MKCNWTTKIHWIGEDMICKLSDIVNTANTGADAIKKAPILNEPTNLRCLRIGDVSQKRDFSMWGYTKTSKMDYERYKLHKGDSIIARTGNTIGVCTYIEDDIESVYNNGLIRLTAKTELARERFLFYLIRSTACQDYIQSIAYGTSTQPNMKIKDFLNFDIIVPTLEIQDKIIAIVDKIEKKIQVNTEINNNLQQQAKAIFSNEFLTLETLPDGWKQASLIDIADYLNGLAMQKYRPTADETGIPVLKIKELRQGCCDDNSELCSPSIKSEYIIHDGDVIFSWSGSLLVDFWCGGICGLNQHLFKVTSNKYNKWFYYAWTKHHLDRFIAVAADKATTMGHIKRDELSKAEVLIPNEADYNRIGALLQPIYEMIISNRIENKKLAATRDTLLPKLMNGEIDMSEVDYE